MYSGSRSDRPYSPVRATDKPGWNRDSPVHDTEVCSRLVLSYRYFLQILETAPA